MASLILDLLVVPTYNVLTLGIADASTYPTDPPSVAAPTLEIKIPGFGTASVVFLPKDFNIINSTILGITQPGDEQPLPDGVYYLRYSVTPAYENYVEKSIMRIEKIQEKFDKAFMTLDMMECDQAIKAQAKVELSTIYFYIQGSVAAANNCAINEATKLYTTADKMLNRFISSDCGCSGNNY